MPGMEVPFLFDKGSSVKAIMNVSILPESAMTDLASTKEITITVSEADVTNDAFSAITPPTASTLTVDASAITMGASIAVASAAIAATLF